MEHERRHKKNKSINKNKIKIENSYSLKYTYIVVCGDTT